MVRTRITERHIEVPIKFKINVKNVNEVVRNYLEQINKAGLTSLDVRISQESKNDVAFIKDVLNESKQTAIEVRKQFEDIGKLLDKVFYPKQEKGETVFQRFIKAMEALIVASDKESMKVLEALNRIRQRKKELKTEAEVLIYKLVEEYWDKAIETVGADAEKLVRAIMDKGVKERVEKAILKPLESQKFTRKVSNTILESLYDLVISRVRYTRNKTVNEKMDKVMVLGLEKISKGILSYLKEEINWKNNEQMKKWVKPISKVFLNKIAEGLADLVVKREVVDRVKVIRKKRLEKLIKTLINVYENLDKFSKVEEFVKNDIFYKFITCDLKIAMERVEEIAKVMQEFRGERGAKKIEEIVTNLNEVKLLGAIEIMKKFSEKVNVMYSISRGIIAANTLAEREREISETAEMITRIGGAVAKTRKSAERVIGGGFERNIEYIKKFLERLPKMEEGWENTFIVELIGETNKQMATEIRTALNEFKTEVKTKIDEDRSFYDRRVGAITDLIKEMERMLKNVPNEVVLGIRGGIPR